MFTGIITQTTKLKKIKGDLFYFIKPKNWRLKVGESINIDGVCSTIVKIEPSYFIVQYMPETLKIIKKLKINDLVNLEQSLKIGDRLGGHFVMGHVDGQGEVLKFKNKILKIKYPKKFKKYVVYKGSIAINGVSLTIISDLAVALIDYTLKRTNLGKLKRGDKVNLEFDLLAKLVK